ncbi:nadp-dependent leukotriene b4 12-hydroxydehydrogenase [Diaporthe amygdali]|uniref:nadp-dependent leukotriene b4 12-hydroxydehydrogenase n=1 Tax=Phomopsis amygdali TaxID=1214568 RepID=UPI0022FF2B32|nr:nadp-dependent leukotriene b4 12-hydroxydehydrogenase [Diaporthe amygdali]KAJ0117331.1 nadp-dependent leukotriene b4 12-hydroxydehydrogenase [Diaporthe amygdali]
MSRQITSVVLAERPKGDIVPGKTFQQKQGPAPKAEDLKDGQILVETLYLSLDPAMRGWLDDVRSYVPPVQIGEVMRGSAIARVLASKSPRVKDGDLVTASTGWREVAIVGPKEFDSVSDIPLPKNGKVTDLQGVLGMTGLTAYFGMTTIGNVKPGETVVVSGAAGATGSVAAQMAKIAGGRVVGLAGSDAKCAWLEKELGFDVCLNYKDPDFRKKFKEATPKYIDVYFDNVGGEILDAALSRANKKARFIMCGAISQYNSTDPKGPRQISKVITQRVRMEGFIVFDFVKEYPAARKQLAQWLAEGKIKRQETVVKGGLKVAEQALLDLFKGGNTGKLLVEVKSPEEKSKL